MQVRNTDILDLAAGPLEITSVLLSQGAAFMDALLFCGAPGGIAIFCNEFIAPAQGSPALTFPLVIDWQLLRGLGSPPRVKHTNNSRTFRADMAGKRGAASSPVTVMGGPGCVWDPVPVATGATNVANAAGLQREGLLFQVTGSIPDWWLLRARVSSAVGVELTMDISAMRCEGCVTAGAPVVTVGNMIG